MIFVNKVRDYTVAEQQLLNQLITLLLADGRTEDLKKSASDREYQLRLLKEYGLV